MSRAFRGLSFLAVLIVGLGGCDAVGPEGLGDLDTARARWQQAAVASYTYTLTRGCFCPPESVGPVQIRVVAGQVVERTLVATGLPIVGNDERWPAVEGLFDYAERALRDADDVTIRYDPSLGYPIEISVDWIRQAVDDEEALSVGSFAAQ